MKELKEDIINFFLKQHYTTVTTIDSRGYPHSSCKGIVHMDKKGQVYLLDVYRRKTLRNLKHNHHISITAVDEHKFIGYCLKGVAEIVRREEIESHIISVWEDRIIKRLSHRLLKNLKGEKGHPRHPEELLPKPEYLIVVEVREIVNLTPYHIRQGEKCATCIERKKCITRLI